MRAFLGIPLAEATREALALALGKAPAWPGKKVAAKNWHVTLVFLGTVSIEQRATLAAALDGAALGKAFTLATGAYGAFPSTAEASIAWLGMRTGLEELATLQRAVAKTAASCGFATERDFQPHLTLSRIDPPANLSRAVCGAPPPLVTLPVERVALFSSVPGPAGSDYAEVASWPLA